MQLYLHLHLEHRIEKNKICAQAVSWVWDMIIYHYFVISRQVSPCHQWKQGQAAAHGKSTHSTLICINASIRLWYVLYAVISWDTSAVGFCTEMHPAYFNKSRSPYRQQLVCAKDTSPLV